jgi:hypothetical protein
MMSARATVMTATLVSVLAHSSPAFAGYLDTTLGGFMMLAHLNLAIIVFLGFYVSATLKKARHNLPRKNEPKNVSNLIKHNVQSVDQSSSALINALRLSTNQDRGSHNKTRILPKAWPEKPVQSRHHPHSIDACWIKTSKESCYVSGPDSQSIGT